MVNFQIKRGGGRRRGTRVHVFLNYIIKLNKIYNRKLGWRWWGELHILCVKVVKIVLCAISRPMGVRPRDLPRTIHIHRLVSGSERS